MHVNGFLSKTYVIASSTHSVTTLYSYLADGKEKNVEIARVQHGWPPIFILSVRLTACLFAFYKCAQGSDTWVHNKKTHPVLSGKRKPPNFSPILFLVPLS